MATPLTISIKRLFSGLPKKVKVQNYYVGEGQPVFIVAEIGCNHNGDMKIAKALVRAAKDAGADAVKFQKRTVDEVFIREMLEMPYDNWRSFAKTYGENREKQELSTEGLRELKEYSEQLGLVFFVTPFDQTSADALENIGVHAYKIASCDVTNLPLLKHVATKGKPILLSTGASTLEEIDLAVETILALNDRVILNHCTSMYPTPDEHIDLNMVRTLIERYYPLPVGYSGHELDTLPTVVSIGHGARTVERHFTLDKKMRGPDHHMSLTPTEFKAMVKDIRRAEAFLGSSIKRLHKGEMSFREKHGKSIVAKRHIRAGERITRDALAFKSPGDGFKPSLVEAVVGRRARVEIPEDSVIRETHLV